MSDRDRDRRDRRDRSRSRSRSRDRHREKDRDRGDRERDRDRDRPSRQRSRERLPDRREEGERGHHRHRDEQEQDRRRPRSPMADTRHPDQRQEQYQQRPPERHLPPPPPARQPISDQPPQLGSIYEGAVHTIRAFGVFVALKGYRKHVLVHHTQLRDDIRFSRDEADEDKVKSMEYFFPKGQPAWVKITEVTPDPVRVGEMKVCGVMRVVDQETGADLDPDNKATIVSKGGPLSDQPPEVGIVLRGTVKRIEPYGVFVSLEGFKKYGLVHSSHVGNYISFTRETTDEEKKAELAGVVGIGDQVYAKVVEVVEDDGSGRGAKVQCSIKLVDQKTGEDLDPLGTRYKSRGEGGGGGRGGAAPIGADAGVVVGGKINWGHLAGDTLTKHAVGDVSGTYKLLEGAKDEMQRPPPPPNSYEMIQRGNPSTHDILMDMPAPPPPPRQITTVEEALAILEQASKSKGKKKKKDKDKKKKKEKDKDKKKSKKSKSKDAKPSSKSKRQGSSSSSDSDSSSDG